MIKKQYDIILFICSIIIIFSSIVLLKDVDIILYFIIVFFISFFMIFILQLIYVKKLVEILDNECDPKRFIDEYKKFHKIKSNENLIPFHVINMSAGLISLGEFKEAVTFLENINVIKLQNNKLLKVVYYINLCASNIELGNLDKAEEYLNEIDMVKFDRKANIINSIRINDVELKVKQGNIIESRKILNQIVDLKQSKRQCLEVMFLSAILDIEDKKIDSAKEGLEKVIELGNELYIVKKAKAELIKLK